MVGYEIVGVSQGASIALTLYLYLGPSREAKFKLLSQDECESLLDWHFTLPDVLDLTPPFTGEFLGSHWADILTCLNVHGL